MVVSASSRAVQQQRHPAWPPEGPAMWITSFMGRDITSPASEPAPPPEALFPCAFLIHQEPGVAGPAHFHVANEFQIVVQGGGLFGKEAVDGICVHYAGAYSPYGPLLAGTDGLSYMTLRDTYDGGAHIMPAKRDLLKAAHRKPRALLKKCGPASAPSALRTLRAPECRPVVPLHEDGLAAWLYRIPPGGSSCGENPADGGGQFWLVVGGEQSERGGSLPVRSCTFVSADEPAFRLQAGAAGLEILALQFPQRREA